MATIQCARSPGGWRAYIPAAYNASAGGHEVNITVNGETLTRTITVLPKDFGTVELAAGAGGLGGRQQRVPQRGLAPL